MSPRHSFIRGDHIEYGFWLIFDGQGNVRLSRGEPSLDRFSRGMSCSVKLPRSVFQTPQLRATITLAEGVATPPAIDVEAVAGALREVIGCDVDFRVNAAGPDGSEATKTGADDAPGMNQDGLTP